MIILRSKSWAGEALSTVCAVLLFVVMFDHVTAVKFIGLGILIAILAVLASTSMLGNTTRRSLPPRPLLLALAAWAAWTLISTAWSFDREVSLGAWLDEVLYPFAAFFGFWLIGKEALNKRRLQTVAWVTCLILAVMDDTPSIHAATLKVVGIFGSLALRHAWLKLDEQDEATL